ncbi:MAG: SAM-dependent methyltransferase [Pseudomonadota bacterium]
MPETLKDRITRHITVSGPLPLSEFMHWSMADNKDGYYKSETVIGSAGDFTTAPEVSQIFGELIGIWAILTWQAMDSPTPFNLVELGPGRGTLMQDLLRAVKTSPEFSKAVQVHLVETSDALREVQKEKLTGEPGISWHSSLRNIPPAPTILIANEFLDVLPFHQYVKVKDKWHERVVGLNEAGDLTFVLSNNTIEASSLASGHQDEPEGSIFEIAPTREAFVSNTAEIIAGHGGAALFIDYGHAKAGFGDTFQALREHKFVSPLEAPGKDDLTSHVDFEPLTAIAIANECTAHPLVTQADFLISLGLLERAGHLGRGANSETQNQIQSDVERLAGPKQMGNLFKVFAFSTLEKLAPFDAKA